MSSHLQAHSTEIVCVGTAVNLVVQIMWHRTEEPVPVSFLYNSSKPKNFKRFAELLEGKTAPAPFFDWKQLETTNISVKDTKSNHEESKFLPSAAYILEDAYIAIIWALFHYLLTGYNLPSQDFGSFSVVTNLRTPDGSLAFPRQSLRRAERAKTEPSGVKFKPSGGDWWSV